MGNGGDGHPRSLRQETRLEKAPETGDWIHISAPHCAEITYLKD